jgi:hypothetical protein
MMIQTAAETTALKAVASEGAGMRSVRETLDSPASSDKWLATPFKVVETAAVAVFHDQLPPASLIDLVAKVTPRPLLLMYSGTGQGGEVQLNPEFYRAAGNPRRSGRSPVPATRAASTPNPASMSDASSSSSTRRCSEDRSGSQRSGSASTATLATSRPVARVSLTGRKLGVPSRLSRGCVRRTIGR